MGKANSVTARRIAVVDDDPQIRYSIKQGLEQEGYRVVEAEGGEALMRLLEREEEIDLISLDLNLGRDDGLELAHAIRQRSRVPIIMITSRSGPHERLQGLDVGADDYIVKPFLLREMVLRIEAVLRRRSLEGWMAGDERGADQRSFRFADFRLDDEQHRLTRVSTGEDIPLTTSEFTILRMLLQSAGQVVSRDAVCEVLRGRKWSPYDRTIDTVVGRLRKKLDREGQSAPLIQTVWGKGYMLASHVESLASA